MATNHRVDECPVKRDEERIRIHRKIFTNQSVQAQEQSELFSTRYTSDSKDYRGFKPGKISDALRSALGIRSNQLPPYIYLMRELGYPIGWLLEAQVKKSDLELVNDNDAKTEEMPNKELEYDEDKIIGFPGFNEELPSYIIDESDRYGVEKYGPKFSKSSFLKTLNLRKKRSFRRTLVKENSNLNGSDGEESETELSNESIEDRSDENESVIKKQKYDESYGTAVVAIPGTPVIDSMSGIKQVPDWQKFSENICEHKPFDMENMATIGSYQNIVKITREFKNKSIFQ